MNKKFSDSNYFGNINGYYGHLSSNNMNFFPINHLNNPNSMNNKSYQDSSFKIQNNIFKKNFGESRANIKQNLLVVRHGERVDSTFGTDWLGKAFDVYGNYTRFNLNMPKELIERENPFEFDFDPPLTEIGLLQAKLHGEELARIGFNVKHVYSSPALRSIQTADKILEGMGLKEIVPIKIETGLFEILSWQWYIPAKCPFLSPSSLKSFGYNIDINYNSIIPREILNRNESLQEYYQRSYYMTKKIADIHDNDGGIMLVGHAPSLESCTRLLCGGKMKSLNEFAEVTRKIPFLSIANCEKESCGRWSLRPLPIATMKHLQLEEFDWNNLNTPFYYRNYNNNNMVGFQDCHRSFMAN